MKQNSLISKSYKRKDTFVGTEIITLVREFILELKLSSFSIDRRKRNIKNDKNKNISKISCHWKCSLFTAYSIQPGRNFDLCSVINGTNFFFGTIPTERPIRCKKKYINQRDFFYLKMNESRIHESTWWSNDTAKDHLNSIRSLGLLTWATTRDVFASKKIWKSSDGR